ncbi:MAG: P1 family peptidase [Deltaproteobacteria bacterium]
MPSLTDVPGISVGHASNYEAATGCTVVLIEGGAAGAVDLRGGGTSTRQIDGLLPHHYFRKIHAIFLTGGSAYGLDAAAGVMRYLEERGEGLAVGYGMVVPSVPTAVIFDLGIGNPRVRPDAAMAYEACLMASRNAVAEGSVGAGTGATIGKIFGAGRATKGGVGGASFTMPGGAVIGAMVVVNAFGDVIDPKSAKIIAGVRNSPEGREFLGTGDLIRRGFRREDGFQNTTLAVVAVNAPLSKPELSRVAVIAQTGITRVISPAHTASDGDLVFAISTGGGTQADANSVGVIAAELVSEAIIRAVNSAEGLAAIPSSRDLRR